MTKSQNSKGNQNDFASGMRNQDFVENGDLDEPGQGDRAVSAQISDDSPSLLSGEALGKTIDQVSDLPDPRNVKARSLEMKQERAEKQKMDPLRKISRSILTDKAEAMEKLLQITPADMKKYTFYKNSVKAEIRELRVILEGLEAKEKERVWIKNQTTGDLDDRKLIDGLTGERAIYMRRSDQVPLSSFYQPLPKRMHFVFDLSMSMSRYKHDGRLERSLEAAVMMMESLKSFEHKYSLKLSGHSGDTDNFLLADWNKLPKTDKERLMVIKQMHAHTEMCGSGDNTMLAAKRAIIEITREKADEYFVFLISDANLGQYGITAEIFSKLHEIDPRVHFFTIFIASPGDDIKEFEKELPGKVFNCLDKSQLPKTLKMIFLQAAMDGR